MIGTGHIRTAPDATELAHMYGVFISVRARNLPPVVVVADLIVRQVDATHTTHLGGFTPRMKTGGMELVVASRKLDICNSKASALEIVPSWLFDRLDTGVRLGRNTRLVVGQVQVIRWHAICNTYYYYIYIYSTTNRVPLDRWHSKMIPLEHHTRGHSRQVSQLQDD